MNASPIPALLAGLCLAFCAACSQDKLATEPSSSDWSGASSADSGETRSGQLTDAERLDIARDIVSLQNDPAMINAFMQQMAPRLAQEPRPRDRSRCDALSNPERGQQCVTRAEALLEGRAMRAAETMDQFRLVLEDSLDELAAITARTYTDEELIGIRDFYRSPVGQGVLNKQPRIAAEFLPIVFERAQSAQKQVADRTPPPGDAGAEEPLP